MARSETSSNPIEPDGGTAAGRRPKPTIRPGIACRPRARRARSGRSASSSRRRCRGDIVNHDLISTAGNAGEPGADADVDTQVQQLRHRGIDPDRKCSPSGCAPPTRYR